MKNTPLTGKRYINLLRCSTVKQGDTSIPDQKKNNDLFAREVGMVWVRDVELSGTSASKTFNRRDLDTLVNDARTQKNFDVLLVHDLSRLTRGGIRHAAHVRRQFEKAGVRVISANDNIPEGDEAEFFEAFIHWKNKTYAKNLAQQAARGSRSSLEAGRRPHCSHTPFGFDRLYSGPDGSPRYILRQVHGQLRHHIDCASRHVRAITPDASGRFHPFQKQHDECSKLIMGATENVEAVRLMFKMRYTGSSFKEIGHELTKRGVLPSFASFWHPTTIRYIVLNPIYLGRAVACRIALGVHVVLASGRPQKTPVNQSDYEDTDRKSIDPIHRPRADWFEREEPQLADYIADPVIRERADAAIEKAFENFVLPRPENYLALSHARRERHRQSAYILSNVLCSKDGDFPLRGRTQGNGESARRTYMVGEYIGGNPKATHLSQYLPANQPEQVVLSVLRSLFCGLTEIGSMIEAAVEEIKKQQPSLLANEKNLREEDQTLGRKIRRLINASSDTEADPESDEQIQRWKLRRQQIKNDLLLIQRDVREIDPKCVVKQVADVIFTPEDKLDGESYFRLRNVINAWCSSMRVDLVTRELTFVVGVPPEWALAAISRGEELCLQGEFTRQVALEAHRVNRLILGEYRCWSPHGGLPVQRWPHKWGYQWDRVHGERRKVV